MHFGSLADSIIFVKVSQKTVTFFAAEKFRFVGLHKNQHFKKPIIVARNKPLPEAR